MVSDTLHTLMNLPQTAALMFYIDVLLQTYNYKIFKML